MKLPLRAGVRGSFARAQPDQRQPNKRQSDKDRADKTSAYSNSNASNPSRSQENRGARRRLRFRKRLPAGPQAMPELVDRLNALADDADTVSVEDLVRTIGAQGHAPLLLVAGLFMVLPIGMIPGMGGALGILVAMIGIQMLMGHNEVSVPRFFGKRAVSAARLQQITAFIRPTFVWLRRHLKIRFESLSGGAISLKIIAVILIVTGGSLLVLGAIPVAVPLMGLPIILFAFGLLARDGAVVAAGYIVLIAISVTLFLLQNTLMS